MASKGPSLALEAPRRAEGYDGPHDGRLSGGRRPQPRPGYARPVSLCLEPAAARTRVSSADLGTTFEMAGRSAPAGAWLAVGRQTATLLFACVFGLYRGYNRHVCRGLR